jgi:hypothetical protein
VISSYLIDVGYMILFQSNCWAAGNPSSLRDGTMSHGSLLLPKRTLFS